MSKYTVLVIEDETQINKIICTYFKRSKFNVLSACNGFEGLEIFSNNKIDFVCLDIIMPNVNGWEVAATIRETSNVPIMMMSALSEDEDILKGYSLKVDDYIVKPFNPKILIAKANTILDRYSQKDKVDTSFITVSHITINLHEHRAFVDEIELSLSKTEFDLLVYFIKHEGQICSRNLLLDKVWGPDAFVEDRIVDTYIKKLRKYLGKYSGFIKTIFGVGYRFEVEE